MAVDDTHTTSLLHFNGADASTTFTDESGKTWTAYGNAQIDTAQNKFGTASGLFDGTGDYIDTPDVAEHEVGSGNFTIDFWIRFNSTTGIIVPFTRRTGGAAQKDLFSLYLSSGTWTFQAIVNTVEKAKYTFSWTPSTSTWYHMAVVRSGSNFYIFKDGVAQTLTAATAIGTNDLTFSLTGEKLTLARYGDYNDFYLNGWIDEFRFSKGIARWTSDFTSPTAEYEPNLRFMSTNKGWL